MRRQVLGTEHPDVAASATNLSFWLTQAGQYDEAESLIEESLGIRRRVFGESSAQVAGALTVKANLLLEAGRFAEALNAAGQARAFLAANLPPGHWRTAMAQSAEGAALVGLDAYAEAEPLLLSSHATLADSAMGMALLSQQSYNRLYQLYSAWGKTNEAVKYRLDN